MIPVSIGPDLRACCPSLVMEVLECSVVNREHDPDLWQRVEQEARTVAQRVPLDQISRHPEIQATREAYKRCGKDPNRYRPSAEALRRRVVQGKGLFRVNVVVDAVNLVSLASGCSINGFDAARIEGEVTWGIGRAREPYTAIGGGALNIEGLPVARDARGPVGTPTRDEDRVRIEVDTTRVLLTISAYVGGLLVDEVLGQARDLLIRHAAAADVQTTRLCAGPASTGGIDAAGRRDARGRG